MLNLVTLTGTFDDGTGAPLSGTVQFTPNVTVYASGIPVLQPDVPIQAQIIAGQLKNSSGAALQLIATDNSGLIFEGQTGFFCYTVSVTVSGQALPSWQFFLPSSPSTRDLYSLANTPAGGVGFTNPMTQLGQIIYGGAAGTALALAGNSTSAFEFLQSQGAGGTAQAPFWGTITASQVPGFGGVNVPGTASAGWYPRGASSTAAAWGPIQAGDLPPAGTASAGIVTFDASALDFKPIGGPSAGGGTGKAAYSDHAHPYEPWQFCVTDTAYGAKGNGRIVTDLTIGSGNLSQASSVTANFSTAGSVIISGAGSGGGYLVTTYTVVNSTTITLANAASQAVANKGAIFGTDDTAAIKAAIAAAFAYAQANNQYAEVVFPPLLYVIAGAATVGGASTLGNAIFPLPIVTGSAAPKVTLAFRGLQADSAALLHWLQPNIQVTGAVLAILNLNGTVDPTYGPASVIGGPYSGYGGATSVFSNMCPVIDRLSCLVPFNSTFSGFDFFGCAEAFVPNAAVLPMAIVPSGGAWPQISNGSITNAPQFGLRMPDVNNNDRCTVIEFSGEGLCYCVMPSEHSTVLSVRAINCIVGIQAYASSSTPHGAHIHYASVEACAQVFGVLSTGTSVKCQIDQLDIEGPTQYVLFDTASLFIGEIRFRNFGTGYLTGATNSVSGGARLINLDQQSGPVTSPHAPPGSGTAWTNFYWRDAEITAFVGGGTLSALTITNMGTVITSQIVPASTSFYRFGLPSGHSYTPAYTGGGTALTHTVTLF